MSSPADDTPPADEPTYDTWTMQNKNPPATGADIPLHAQEVTIVKQAMDWMEDNWPFDPQAASERPSPQFDLGEILPPGSVAVRHYDGYQIGRILLKDGQWVFERDYKEEAR